MGVSRPRPGRAVVLRIEPLRVSPWLLSLMQIAKEGDAALIPSGTGPDGSEHGRARRNTPSALALSQKECKALCTLHAALQPSTRRRHALRAFVRGSQGAGSGSIACGGIPALAGRGASLRHRVRVVARACAQRVAIAVTGWSKKPPLDRRIAQPVRAPGTAALTSSPVRCSPSAALRMRLAGASFCPARSVSFCAEAAPSSSPDTTTERPTMSTHARNNTESIDAKGKGRRSWKNEAVIA